MPAWRRPGAYDATMSPECFKKHKKGLLACSTDDRRMTLRFQVCGTRVAHGMGGGVLQGRPRG